jgi:hypothetical protein
MFLEAVVVDGGLVSLLVIIVLVLLVVYLIRKI